MSMPVSSHISMIADNMFRRVHEAHQQQEGLDGSVAMLLTSIHRNHTLEEEQRR